MGYKVVDLEQLRLIKSSAQQGWRKILKKNWFVYRGGDDINITSGAGRIYAAIRWVRLLHVK